jgi:hypothetical protein
MTLLHLHRDAKPEPAPLAPRRPRMGGVSVTPLAASVATLLAIAWVVSFQHDHSSLYDTAAHPDRPAASASAKP